MLECGLAEGVHAERGFGFELEDGNEPAHHAEAWLVPDVAAGEQQRLTAARRFVATLAGKGPLRGELDHDTAAEITWVHISPGNYLNLVFQRGWTQGAYQRWLAHTLTAALLPPATCPGQRPPRAEPQHRA